jgi:uncharacterized membrane protein YcaP (DUF421 family)
VELERLLLRTLFAYLVLHQFFRHAGKRTVSSVGSAGNGSGIDLMAALLVGDLVEDMLWAEVPAAQFVTAAGTLVVVHVFLALLRYRSPLVWRLVEGRPRRIVAHGQPVASVMRAERLNPRAVASLLRMQGIDSGRWGEIRAAYIENDGPLSLLLERWARPATKADGRRLGRDPS